VSAAGTAPNSKLSDGLPVIFDGGDIVLSALVACRGNCSTAKIERLIRDNAIRSADFENDASPICRVCKLPV
jgi:hypothetical protein